MGVLYPRKEKIATVKKGMLRVAQNRSCNLPLQKGYVVFLYLLGLAGTCVGVSICLKSAMGIDAWNASIAGLAEITPLSLGTWTVLIHLAFWLISALLDRKFRWLCVFPVIYKGIILDLVKPWIDQAALPDDMMSRLLCFLAGYLVIAVFTGIYIATGYPRMPVDGLMFSLAALLRTDIRWSRLLMEIIGFAVMFWVGGAFGAGTVIMTLTCGYMFSACKYLAEKLLLRSILTEQNEQ